MLVYVKYYIFDVARSACMYICYNIAKGFRKHGNIRPLTHFQGRSVANYNDECVWNGMLKFLCYRLAPCLFRGNHILVNFAQNICIRICFLGSKCKTTPALSLRSLAVLPADYFQRHGNIAHFQRRSLANVFWAPNARPPPALSLRSLAVLPADYFQRHGNIVHFQRRSLANLL